MIVVRVLYAVFFGATEPEPRVDHALSCGVPRRVLAHALLLVLLSGPGAAEPAAQAERRDILGTETKLYSQLNEELIIRDFFQDREKGVFLDVGSAHPRKRSTTYYLERHLDWSGIAVDAREELVPLYQNQRPFTRFFVYIVTDHSGSTESFYMAGPISSTSEDWVKNFPNRKREPVKVEVPTITLNDLLDRNGVTHIDFLSMDIEGGEPAALRGFDIARFKPELVCIEAGIARGADLIAYFHENGYERIDRYLPHDYVNWYFRAKDSDAGAE